MSDEQTRSPSCGEPLSEAVPRGWSCQQSHAPQTCDCCGKPMVGDEDWPTSRGIPPEKLMRTCSRCRYEEWLRTRPKKGDTCLCANCGATLTWDEVQSHTAGPTPPGFPPERFVCNACRWGKR